MTGSSSSYKAAQNGTCKIEQKALHCLNLVVETLHHEQEHGARTPLRKLHN